MVEACRKLHVSEGFILFQRPIVVQTVVCQACPHACYAMQLCVDAAVERAQSAVKTEEVSARAPALHEVLPV